MQLSRSTWRRIETTLIEFFRAEGGEIHADSGERYLIVNNERKICLSELARDLTDQFNTSRMIDGSIAERREAITALQKAIEEDSAS